MTILRVTLVILPVVFAFDFLGEATDGQGGLVPRWYTYVPFLLLSLGQLRRRQPNALWLTVPAAIFVPIVSGLEWYVGRQVGGLDGATALIVMMLLGFVTTLLVGKVPQWAVGGYLILVAATAAFGAVNEGLGRADQILRTVLSVTALGVSAWFAVHLRSSLMLAVSEQRDLVSSRDQLIAAVSHELRTPLTAIAGLSEEISSRGEEMDRDELIELSTIIAEQSADMTDIIEDLLTAAQARAGSLHIAAGKVDIAAEVERVASSPALAPLLASLSLEMRFDAAYAYADPQRCRQIIRNLLSNALRYGGHNIVIEVREDDDTVRLCVSDDGTGLTPDEETRVFEPFFSTPTTRAHPGSLGLGLTISRQLAELMDGALVYSRRGGRTMFEFRLPSAAKPEADTSTLTGLTARPSTSARR